VIFTVCLSVYMSFSSFTQKLRMDLNFSVSDSQLDKDHHEET